MTDVVQTNAAAIMNEGVLTGSALAGRILKKAREDAGIHISALALSLKVPEDKLDALEAGHLADFASPVFVRALASSVCRNLKIDSINVLAHLPQVLGMRLNQQSTLNAPFRGNGAGSSRIGVEMWFKPLVISVILLLLGAGVLFFLPELREFRAYVGDSSESGIETNAALEKNPQSWRSMNLPTNIEVATSSQSPMPMAEPVGNDKNSTVAATVASTVSSAIAINSNSLAAQVNISLGQNAPLLVVNATGDTWVGVTNAKGATLVQRELKAGEAMPVAGMPPLKVVIGRANMTEVNIRGQAFDLKAVTKDNIARFEVK